jgi:hypothetical protein
MVDGLEGANLLLFRKDCKAFPKKCQAIRPAASYFCGKQK